MPQIKTVLYRASLLADNLGIRLCAAAVMVMPSALVFLVPSVALFGAPEVASLAGAPPPDVDGWWTLLSLALGVGFAAAWMRIVFPSARMTGRSRLRRFVTIGLSVGIAALTLELTVLPRAGSPDDVGWLLLASLAVSVFLLAGTLGQPRTDRLNRPRGARSGAVDA